jgi:hypothetical protein
VISARDITAPSDRIELKGNSGADRMYGIQLSDSFVRIHAVESVRCAALPSEILPGAKLLMRNPILKFGTIWLTPQTLVSVSGGVSSLANVYRMKKV